jgi:diaminohydroxyphosphoribosylaminopyrimidine deaminase / 5-amino-6-(5-phosphoribosylamino)uracil reductase
MSDNREADGHEPQHSPSVTLSWAQSADGRIATLTGESKYLSSPESLEIQQELRRDSDAVLVGLGTVLSDDPRLLCRLPPERNPALRQPLRVVLDSHFAIPTDSALVRTAADHPVLVIGALAPFRGQSSAGAQAAALERERALKALDVQTARIPVVEAGASLRLDLRAALALLADRDVRSLFVEGGAAILTSFLAEDLVDRVVLDLAPRFIGTGRNAVADLGVRSLAQARGFRSVAVELRGGNVVWTMER